MNKISFNLLSHLFQLPFLEGSFVHAAVDSRLIKRGDLFFALKGEQTDGHHFLQEAVKNGASGLVINKDYAGNSYDIPIFKVDSPLIALQKLANYKLQQISCKVVGVTGSVGKTTTKDFLGTLLKKKYNTTISPGNYNSQIGLPLTILNHLDKDNEILVLEMGMNQAGQIRKLVEIAPPDIAIINSVGYAHAENFSSLKEIAFAKGEIFSHPKTQLGIYHADIENGKDLRNIGTCEKCTFSLISKEADFYMECLPETLIIYEKGSKTAALTGFPYFEKHNRHNLLAAIVCARALNLNWKEIQDSFQDLSLPEKRFQIEMREGIRFINDSYNASLLSVKAALSEMPPQQTGKKRIAVLGSMLELGNFSEECHLKISQEALDKVDSLFCIGEETLCMQEHWLKEKRDVKWFNCLEKLGQALKLEARQGDTVLVKGSCSLQLWKILDFFKK